MTQFGLAPIKVEVSFDQSALNSEGFFVIGESLIASSGGEVLVEGPWTLSQPSTLGSMVAGMAVQPLDDPGVLHIHKIDGDATGHGSEWATVTVGDSITFGRTYSIESISDSGTYMTLELDPPTYAATTGLLYFVATESGADLIGGDVAYDITDWVYDVAVVRGRSRELDVIQTGTAKVRLRNYDGRFLPEDLNGSSPYLGQVVPGKQVRIAMAGSDVQIFGGRIDEWDYQFKSSGEVDAMFEAVDSMGALASASFSDWTTTAGDTPGERFADVLDRPEVDWGPNRSLGTGVTTLQSDEISWGSNVLNYCSLVAATDRGFFFASRKDTITFIGRDEFVIDVTAFADDPADILTDAGSGGVPFSSIEVTSSSELLYNRVGVDRENGALQTVNSVPSQEAYGVRSLQLSGLLMESDDQAESLARNLLDQYSEPAVRVSAVTVILDALEPNATNAKVPMHDIGDVVKVVWTPKGTSTQVEQLSLVEGKMHRYQATGLHTVTYQLSPADNLTGFIIGSAKFGIIGTSKIGY